MASASREDQAADKVMRDQLDEAAFAELGHRKRAVPARWMQDPTWRCTRQHVSKTFGRDWQERRVCSFGGCVAPVQLTFPEDRTGPMPGLSRDQAAGLNPDRGYPTAKRHNWSKRPTGVKSDGPDAKR